jgi:hypothetical protein
MEETKCYCGHTTYCDCGPETLEEVALKQAQLSYYGDEVDVYVRGSVFGAKWQQEQICNSEFLQKLRATLSDAEARRLIRTI